jgi:hypothetical protein
LGTPDVTTTEQGAEMTNATECTTHQDHGHEHGAGCGHAAVQHGDHTDYMHDGHTHREHDGHWDECAEQTATGAS